MCKIASYLKKISDSWPIVVRTVKVRYFFIFRAYYRLSQIKQKTGLNPHNFQDAIKFQIALWNRSINNS